MESPQALPFQGMVSVSWSLHTQTPHCSLEFPSGLWPPSLFHRKNLCVHAHHQTLSHHRATPPLFRSHAWMQSRISMRMPLLEWGAKALPLRTPRLPSHRVPAPRPSHSLLSQGLLLLGSWQPAEDPQCPQICLPHIMPLWLTQFFSSCSLHRMTWSLFLCWSHFVFLA